MADEKYAVDYDDRRPAMLTEAQRKQFSQDGYLLLDPAVEPPLLAPLRAATGRVTERARTGDWPHARAAGDDLWGVSHLLHPDLGEPVFAQYMASDPVLEVARDLLGPELMLSLVNLLVNPARRDFAIGWHRDLIRQELPPEEEQALLDRHQDSVQWNTALYEEACLLIVPGSHRRAATPEEREVQFRQPLDAMPGELAVALRAGQGVYYNPQLLHRGVYPCGRRRETLHACLLRANREEVTPMHYTALRWMEAPGFRGTLPPRLLPLYDHWLREADRAAGEETGRLAG